MFVIEIRKMMKNLKQQYKIITSNNQYFITTWIHSKISHFPFDIATQPTVKFHSNLFKEYQQTWTECLCSICYQSCTYPRNSTW